MNAAEPGTFAAARDRLAGALLARIDASGHWRGHLSSSALSTATAVTALATVGAPGDADLVRGGLDWLARHANADGGWGDTVRSRSNPSTTALAWAAFGAAGGDGTHGETVRRARAYLERFAGDGGDLVGAIEALYGNDRTFSVPITMTLALSGRLGADGWRRVRPLPFELAMLPRAWFGAMRLPVVSYALPALIAIGQVIHARSGRTHPLRSLARRRTLGVLEGLQPPNGGFLEATPLTSFVTMSLAGMGEGGHVVARRGAAFLRASARADGSWPIDTDLATWVTTLAVKALRQCPGALDPGRRAALASWILGQQGRVVHPYTGAAPGGWAWTDLPGGVPDADDTAGALLALRSLAGPDGRAEPGFRSAAEAGCRWLLGVQNRDGGVPTFCRGWGTLPFDRSTPELTAHALRAWSAWESGLPVALREDVARAKERALHYLVASQRADGAWLPLWFGNEAAADQENPVYGTAQVLAALQDAGGVDTIRAARERGAAFLLSAQNADGGWGGARGVRSSIEETALAVDALCGIAAGRDAADAAARRGGMWLAAATRDPASVEASPIGLYFARLWYFEDLYPLVFATGALGRLAARSEHG
ncbi:MAG: squalene--hopene cyclase [Verrucomicrobia bacterium]|nr:MAG: squalene--hopene cyclase [Verrucomicrobiota bacterium]